MLMKNSAKSCLCKKARACASPVSLVCACSPPRGQRRSLPWGQCRSGYVCCRCPCGRAAGRPQRQMSCAGCPPTAPEGACAAHRAGGLQRRARTGTGHQLGSHQHQTLRVTIKRKEGAEITPPRPHSLSYLPKSRGDSNSPPAGAAHRAGGL